MSQNSLLPVQDWQTQSRGTQEQEYEIYRVQAKSLNWKIKPFDEWLHS